MDRLVPDYVRRRGLRVRQRVGLPKHGPLRTSVAAFRAKATCVFSSRKWSLRGFIGRPRLSSAVPARVGVERPVTTG